ncbi:glycerophosphodiester phosphodiesterase [Sphingomonas sp.]|uniref:glycerophosphodiester phosphodiesterase n=1 Tax=Sphingomonas sp. TaxID=28214 RepID=UPI0025DCD683|nr:glycerophosphodiester phosphodiesterase [Sphingomonas sp.]
MIGSPACAKEAAISTPHPIVIAHRGASGERPEHTIAAYTLAIEQGADFIEPDLVMTKDGQFVARHENNITDTTDVANHPEFRDRKTSKVIDGGKQTGWFTEDFTLAELKTLRARERLPLLRRSNTRYDGQFAIPTLREIIALAKEASARTGRTIGIYPETKHPSYFASIGLPMEAALVTELKAAGWDRADAPVFIQSFEVNNLKALKRMTQVPLIQLLAAEGGPADGAQPSYAAMTTPDGLKAIAAYAAGIGPDKAMAIRPDGTVTPLIADAHAAGLKVHPWTFRAENFFLPGGLRVGILPMAHGQIEAEILRYIDAGVDGFFTDYPYHGVQARAQRSR